MANKVQYGLKNVHYAVFTPAAGSTAASYATPVHVPGAVSLSFESDQQQNKFYADNGPYFLTYSGEGLTGELELALVPDQMLKDLFGDSETATGKVLVDNVNAQPKQFALLFEFEGDSKAVKHVLYRCTASRPPVSSATTAETVEPTTTTIQIVAVANEDGHSRAKTTDNTTTTVFEGWYNSVYEE